MDCDEYFGPELPPNMKPRNEIGPQMPEVFTNKACNDDEKNEDIEEFKKHINSELQSEQTNAHIEDENDTYGPMPCSSDLTEMRKESIIKEIEDRALRTKQFIEGGKKETLKRESWMTELPPQLSAGVGLCNRKFKMNSNDIDTDRSVWTDTPADRERKMNSRNRDKSKNIRSEFLDDMIEEKNARQRKAMKEYDEKHGRTKSLLEMHTEKLKKKRQRSSSSSSSYSSGDESSKKKKKKDKRKKKKKKKEKDEKKNIEETKPVRKPFNRDTDLQTVKMYDGNQMQALLKMSQQLNSKFVQGKS